MTYYTVCIPEEIDLIEKIEKLGSDYFKEVTLRWELDETFYTEEFGQLSLYAEAKCKDGSHLFLQALSIGKGSAKKIFETDNEIIAVERDFHWRYLDVCKSDREDKVFYSTDAKTETDPGYEREVESGLLKTAQGFVLRRIKKVFRKYGIDARYSDKLISQDELENDDNKQMRSVYWEKMITRMLENAELLPGVDYDRLKEALVEKTADLEVNLSAAR